MVRVLYILCINRLIIKSIISETFFVKTHISRKKEISQKNSNHASAASYARSGTAVGCNEDLQRLYIYIYVHKLRAARLRARTQNPAEVSQSPRSSTRVFKLAATEIRRLARIL